MSVEVKDVQEVAEKLQKSFDEFRAKNDKRIDGIESEKSKLAEEVDTLNAKLTELQNLKSDLEAELAAVKRPGGGKHSKEAAEHTKAFELFIRKGRDDGLAELEQKTMNTVSDPDGGYAVPEQLDRDVIHLLSDEVVMRQVSTVIQVGTPAYKKLVDIGGIGAGWVGETDSRPATLASKLAEVNPLWGELYGNPQATQTMLDDAFFDVGNFLVNDLTEAFAEKEEAAFTLGDGVKKPKGFLSYTMAATKDAERPFGTLQNLAAKSATAVTTDELISLLYSLRKKYRKGASWMLNNNALEAIRLLKNAQGDYIWRPGIELDQPSMLLGYGVAENEQMPDMEAGASPISFGNFKRGYYILDRMGTRILRDPYTNKPFVGFYTTRRTGGMVVDSNAIKVLTMKAA
ncbi:MAG: phage major capsid protein [Leclercia adecarboxylata]|nr:phage major capsid protein [Leclercia adecarboxylata]MDU1082777.1 phage major capsid protein [Leclercia adecarboxylata]